MRNFLDVVNHLAVNPAYGLELRSSSASPKPPKRSARPAKRTNSERVIRASPSATALSSLATQGPTVRHRSACRRRSVSRRRTLGGSGGGGGGSSSGDPSSDEDDNEFVLLRNFSVTCKGVVNRGDSVRSRRSSQDSQDSPSPADRARSPVQTTDSVGNNGVPVSVPQRYRVAIVGADGVGKTSLLHQFTTSEFLHAECTTPDAGPCEPTVSVLLNGEEYELSLSELSDVDLSSRSSSEAHAFCVVFSAADRSSFRLAEAVLERLWLSEVVGAKGVILVANKTDLVRGRQVSTEEGKAAASARDCKYIETSVAINHNVDELLVGILAQIRLKQQDPEKARSIFRKRSFSRRKSLVRSSWRSDDADAETKGAADARAESPPDSAVGNGCVRSAGAGGVGSGGAERTVATPAVATVASAAPKKLYRGSKTSASFRMKSLLDKVLARDSKAKSCDKLHVL